MVAIGAKLMSKRGLKFGVALDFGVAGVGATQE